MKIATVILVALILLAPAAMAASATILFPSRMGEVTFSHDKHELEIGVACGICHHTGFEPAVRCGSCHGPQDNIPDLKDAFHLQCLGCHQDRQAGPRGCRDCHRKS